MGQYLFTRENMDSTWLVPIRLFLAGLILCTFYFIKDRRMFFDPWNAKKNPRNLLDLPVEGTDGTFFDVLLHLGTLVAVFAAYWQDIRDMIVELIDGVRDLVRGTTPNPIPPARRMILLIIVGTLPLFVVLPVKDLVEGLSGNIYFVAGALIVTGFLLFASDRVKKGRKTERSAKLLDVLLVGIAQAIATCPGISRSGTTITAGCFVGFDRKFAVRFSFLLSIPAVLGANILTLKDAIQENSIIVSDIPVYLVGVAVAAVVGYICIRLLKMIADKGKFGWFAYYCWAVGLIVLALTLVLK